MTVNYKDFMCLGDGSGGMTECLLRWNHMSTGVFNSLLSTSGLDLRGSKPTSTAAIGSSRGTRNRCVNYDLIVMDMKFTDNDTENCIIKQLVFHLENIMEINGPLIYKTYMGVLLNNGNNVVNNFNGWFDSFSIISTSLMS